MISKSTNRCLNSKMISKSKLKDVEDIVMLFCLVVYMILLKMLFCVHIRCTYDSLRTLICVLHMVRDGTNKSVLVLSSIFAVLLGFYSTVHNYIFLLQKWRRVENLSCPVSGVGRCFRVVKSCTAMSRNSMVLRNCAGIVAIPTPDRT